jgi:hypothetical protein
MTDDQIQSMRSDIAYLKELAVDGQRSGSKVGGAILAAAGLSYTAASLVQWAIVTGRATLSTSSSLFVWLGATVVFMILAFAAKARWGASSNRGPVSRANRSVWIGTGLGIGAISVAYFLAAYTTGNWMFMNLMASTVLAFYGAAWLVSAAMNQARAPGLLSAGCFIAAALLGLLINSPNLLLAYAAALVLFALIPGLVYMRKDRSPA